MSGIFSADGDNRELIPRWYAVFTQPHRETRAATHLRYQGFRTFLPLHRKTVRHARQFRTIRAPFLPRYLFVELTIGRDRWRSVNGTFGVTSLIMEHDRPKPVPFGVVEALAERVDAAGMLSMDPRLVPGQTVRIVTGPFAGLVGKLAALSERDRVNVLLDIMGRRVAVAATRVGLVSAA